MDTRTHHHGPNNVHTGHCGSGPRTAWTRRRKTTEKPSRPSGNRTKKPNPLTLKEPIGHPLCEVQRKRRHPDGGDTMDTTEHEIDQSGLRDPLAFSLQNSPGGPPPNKLGETTEVN